MANVNAINSPNSPLGKPFCENHSKYFFWYINQHTASVFTKRHFGIGDFRELFFIEHARTYKECTSKSCAHKKASTSEAFYLSLFNWCPEEDLNLHDHKSLTPEASASTIPPSGLRARTVLAGLHTVNARVAMRGALCNNPAQQFNQSHRSAHFTAHQ
jgi:hypothetical protein